VKIVPLGSKSFNFVGGRCFETHEVVWVNVSLTQNAGIARMSVAFGLTATSVGTASRYEKGGAEIGHGHLRIRMEIWHMNVNVRMEIVHRHCSIRMEIGHRHWNVRL